MAEISLFRDASEAKPFEKGEVIFREGDSPGREMYVVAEGKVRLSIHGQSVEVVGPGGIFGEMALIDPHPRTATAVVEDEARLHVIDEKRFQFLVQQTPYFAIQVMKIMADRLRRMDARV
jgi:CRP/FNR family cyclic AMP-dependent transcriptional regulator